MTCSFPLFSDAAAELTQSSALIPYPDALLHMDARSRAIAQGEAIEQLWLLEHPPLYTAGTSAKSEDLIAPERFPVYAAGRGGQYTYHGPGQRVAYVMLNLEQRGKDIRCFVSQLEAWIIDTLAEFDVRAERREGRVGVWTELPDGREAKIAAIGVRVRRWVTYHGISINVSPDLDHFGGIVPCGIAQHGVTSLRALGKAASLEQLDRALITQFKRRFGPLASPA